MTLRIETDLDKIEQNTRVLVDRLGATGIGVTINHEEMTEDELNNAISDHHSQLGLPVTDPLTRPASDLVDMVLTAFPALAVVAETITPV